MNLKHYFIAFAFLLLPSISFSDNADGTKIKGGDSVTSTTSTSSNQISKKYNNLENEISEINSKINTLKSEVSNLNMYLIILLTLNIIVITAAMYLYFRIRKIEYYFDSLFKNKSKLDNFVKSKIEDELIRNSNQLNLNTLTKNDFEKLFNHHLSSKYDIIVDYVRNSYRLDEKQIIDDTNSSKQNNVSSNQNVNYLYASAADRLSNTFFNVTDKPDGDSIYRLLETNKNVAEFDLYDAIYNKILNNPGKLECACEWQSSGSNKSLKVVEKGIAQKRADGKWEITKKANIYFN